MKIINDSAGLVKVAVFRSDDMAQFNPISGGAFNLDTGESREFHPSRKARRRVRVKFFVPGDGSFDKLITEALADSSQIVTLGEDNRATINNGAKPPAE